MCCRAHAKFFSDARQHDDKEKSVKQQISQLLFVLVFVAATKKNVAKRLPNNQGNFFSKSLSNVSSDSGHKAGGNFGTTYVFASYCMCS